jgi:excisionase family DNA binding protein
MTDQLEILVLNPGYWMNQPFALASILRSGPGFQVADPTGQVPNPNETFIVVDPAYWASKPLELQDALIQGGAGTSSQTDPSMFAPGVTPTGQERLTLTVEEAALALGISRSLAYESVRRGDIPHIKIGRRVLIPRVALDTLLASAGTETDSRDRR